MTVRRGLRLALGAAVVLTLAWGLLRFAWWTPTGVTRIVYSQVGFAGPSSEARAGGFDLGFMNVTHGPRRYFSARWHGIWYVERGGTVDLHLAADDWARLTIDGTPLMARDVSMGSGTVTMPLAAGPHTVVVDYEQDAGNAFLTVQWAPAGEAPRAFDTSRLFLTPPSPSAPGRNRLVSAAALVAATAWALVGALGAPGTCALLRKRVPRGTGPLIAAGVALLAPRARLLAALAVIGIVALAAALRFEAICTQYGPFSRPAWLFELEAHTRDRIGAIRPDVFAWQKVDRPYVGGDPINYIRNAREMRGFYAAHVREPMFPFVTRLWLPLVDGQDVAVSFASATFSLLAVWATYLVGAAAFTRSVGLIAALGLAIDKDMATWGADGWRDDAMTAFVALFAWALVRSARRPSWPTSVLIGVIGAGAVLTRITALSFVVPSLALIALWPRQPPLAARVRGAVLATLVLAALVAPYFLNCWREYGDPLYAINYHTTFYRARSGQPFDKPMTAAGYLAARWREDPVRLGRLVVEGLTTYPFALKWVGFDFWYHGLGRALKWLAVAGLVVMATSPRGLLLLVVLVTSLVPYAFTWHIPGGGEWRFTMHAYPFYLVAVGLAVTRLVSLVWRRIGPSKATALN